MLSKIKAKNFLSWTSLEFEVSKGITLIDGWNKDDQRSEGSGKSAILNSISWCLFGSLPKEANVDDVIKDGETSCSVTLEFNNGDSITRSRKPNDLYLTINDQIVKGKDANETKSMIEEYIGLNFETFCQSVYFAQNYDKKFLLAKQAEKGKILSSIQNLQIFDKARKEAMDLLSLEDKKLVNLSAAETIIKNEQISIQSQIEMSKALIKEKQDNHQRQLRDLQQRIEAERVKEVKLKLELEVNQNSQSHINVDKSAERMQDIKIKQSEIQQEIGKITYKISENDSIKKSILYKEHEGKTLANKYETISAKIQGLENIDSKQDIIKLKEKILKCENYETSEEFLKVVATIQELDAFIQNPTKTCPTCQTELKNLDTTHTQQKLQENIELVQNLINTNTANLENLRNELAQTIRTYAQTKLELEAEQQQILAQLQDISVYLNDNPLPDLAELTANKFNLEQALNTLSQEYSEEERLIKCLESAKAQEQHIKQQLVEVLQNITSINNQIENLKAADVDADLRKLNELTSKLEEKSEEAKAIADIIVETKAYVARLTQLKDGFKEIKSYVFTNALNELNFRVNQYLSELFDVEASIKFSNDDQVIESKIIIDGKERSLGLLSGGQSRRFNLAVDLALSDIVSFRKTSKLNVLIFDEYFKDLSEISMESCLELLKTRKSPVILIEHNSLFKNVIDNTYYVTMEDGTSTNTRT